jgi:hypothetical protein
MRHGVPQFFILKPDCGWVAIALLLTACSSHQGRPRAQYVPLTEIETVFGPLITAGNHPTGDQSGTGDRLGLFRNAGGTIWGLPLATMADGAWLGVLRQRCETHRSQTATLRDPPLLVPRMSQPAGVVAPANWNSCCETHRERSNGAPSAVLTSTSAPSVGLRILRDQSKSCFTIGLRRCHRTNKAV